jgi:hypothetical protein
VITDAPPELAEIIWFKLGMRPSWRSSGAVTALVVTEGLAPGYSVSTWITGNSTCGNAATGNARYASAPVSSNAAIRRVVATGRRMNGRDGFIARPPAARR